MSHQEMQDAWVKSGIRPTPVNYTVFKAAWYAAHKIGYAAGMERAAGICDLNSEQWDTAANGTAAYAAGRCADAIRAEIPKGGDE